MSNLDPIEKKTAELYRTARYSSIGIELGISVVIGTLGGWWADSHLESSPWGLLIGMGLGITAAIRSISRTLRQLSEEESEHQSDHEPDSE